MKSYRKYQILLLFVIICGLFATVSAADTASDNSAALSVGEEITDSEPVPVQILAVNDFHGQIIPGKKMNGRPVGGAAVLAAYLKDAMKGKENETIIALPGDIIGASPPESGLLYDEPTMIFWNSLGNDACTGDEDSDTACNLVATVGNHEFDLGETELYRIVNGGNGDIEIPRLEDPYPGFAGSMITANIINNQTGESIFPPYVIREVNGVKIGFIGALYALMPEISLAANIEGLTFADEAEMINRYVPELQDAGVHTIVVLLHDGGTEDAYEGDTRDNTTISDDCAEGRVDLIMPQLDPDVDVVISAHTHKFSNAYMNSSADTPILVTQAWSYSLGYADIDLLIDPATGDVIHKTAAVVPAYADQPPGTTPDPESAALVAETLVLVDPLIEQVFNYAPEPITRTQTEAGESSLGDLIADSHRAGVGADFGFISSGSIRADLDAGNITYGELYATSPFGNMDWLVSITGSQVISALEQQWRETPAPYNLQVSGLTYTYDPSQPFGSRIVSVDVNGSPIDPDAVYTAGIDNYLATGGDGYTVFTEAEIVRPGEKDLDTLIDYVKDLPEPVYPPETSRVTVIGNLSDS